MPTSPSRPAPLACDGCRRKHLRCDGADPCQRCANGNLTCTFTASRRGLGRRSRSSNISATPAPPGRRTNNDFQAATARLSNGRISVAAETITHGSSAAQPAGSRSSIYAGSGHGSDNASQCCHMPPEMDPMAGAPLTSDSSHLVDLYYAHFHPSHPFLVARSHYAMQRYPHCVHAVVCWTGRWFSTSAINTVDLAELVSADILHREQVRSAHQVQALLISGILLHAGHQPKLAETCIARAMGIAIELGLNQPTFAQSYPGIQSSTVEQESLRRTWWELYIIDIYLAGLHQRARSLDSKVLVHPYLPTSQNESSSDDYQLRQFDEFRDRVFLANHEDTSFPTYCYRIEAAQIMERILLLDKTRDIQPDSVQAIDNALAAWKYSLPSHSPSVIDSTGTVDQMLFQAHCFILCAGIFLHFPRSDLPATIPGTTGITGGNEYQRLVPASAQHTVKAIAASKELSDLAAIPWPLDQHSPLFACAMVMGSIVQLAAASMHIYQRDYDCLQQHRDRIALMFGVLRCLGPRWAVADRALNRLKPVAHIIFANSSSSSEQYDTGGGSAADSGISMFGDLANVTWTDLLEMEDFLT